MQSKYIFLTKEYVQSQNHWRTAPSARSTNFGLLAFYRKFEVSRVRGKNSGKAIFLPSVSVSDGRYFLASFRVYNRRRFRGKYFRSLSGWTTYNEFDRTPYEIRFGI